MGYHQLVSELGVGASSLRCSTPRRAMVQAARATGKLIRVAPIKPLQQ
jgi:hypothetical protein